MFVIKRDGRKESFNFEKVISAVTRANVSLDKPLSEEDLSFVIGKIEHRLLSLTKDSVEIEEIQNIVVSYLKKYCKRLYKHYSKYREDRARIRDAKYNGKYWDTILSLVNGEDTETSKENGNKDASQIHVMRDLVAGETSKKLYREHVMPSLLKDLHDNGVLHVHDCDYRLIKAMTNCGLVNLFDMLTNGTVMNGKMIEPQHTLQTAATVTTQIISAVASSQYGGITFTISHLAYFVDKSRQIYRNIFSNLPKEQADEYVDLFLKREISSAIKTIYYQLNTLFSTNGQSPFCTIFLYADEYPEWREDTVLLIKEVLRRRIKGMKSPTGHWINPTFPKLVLGITETMFDENHEDYELTKLSAECVAKRMVPDFMSIKKVKEFKEGNVIPPMGCRSFLSPYKNEQGQYEIYGRANTGVISINLPYLALESETIEEFHKKVEDMIDYVSNEQYKIYDTIVNSETSIAPVLWEYGAYGRYNGKIGESLKNMRCSVSIGYMGIAECSERFGIHYNSKEGHEFGINLIKLMHNRTQENKEKLNIPLGLYGTPAESLTTKFANAIKKFPKMEWVNDRNHITNSYHIQVEEEIDAFSKIDFESEFQKYSHNGAISYIEAPDIRKNPEVVISLMKHIYDKMMYCEVNTTSCSVCFKCNFEGEIKLTEDGSHGTCPNCGNTDQRLMSIVYRACGYLASFAGGTSKGRASDINGRVKHL